jgi:uncharacterized protein (DUF3084 family)
MCAQVRLQDAGQKAELARLRAEREEGARAVADLQRRHVQWQHEARRHEHEYARLQQRLRDLLTEKARVSLHARSGSSRLGTCAVWVRESAACMHAALMCAGAFMGSLRFAVYA